MPVLHTAAIDAVVAALDLEDLGKFLSINYGLTFSDDQLDRFVRSVLRGWADEPITSLAELEFGVDATGLDAVREVVGMAGSSYAITSDMSQHVNDHRFEGAIPAGKLSEIAMYAAVSDVCDSMIQPLVDAVEEVTGYRIGDPSRVTITV